MKRRLKSKLSRIFTSGPKSTHEDGDPSEGDVELITALSEPAYEPSPALIDELPNELIIAIFRLNAQCNQSSFMDTLYASHTCERWRTIALGCPELWRRYVFLHTQTSGPRSLEFSQAMLGRCGELTLDVGWERVHRSYRVPPGLHHGSLTLAGTARSLELDTMHRFRSYVVMLNGRFEGLAGRQWKKAQPITALEELVLDTGDILKSRTFSSKFLDDNGASLRSLQLRGCWIDGFTRIRVENLQVLEVSLGPHHPAGMTMDDWIRFLGNCSNLVKLGISSPNYLTSVKIWEARAVTGTAPVKKGVLPRLTELNLNLSSALIPVFLRNLKLPSLRFVSLSFPNTTTLPILGVMLYRNIVDDIMRRMILPHVQSLSRPHSQRDSRLQVAIEHSRYLYIGFTPETVPSTERPPDSGDLQFPWSRTAPPNDWVEIRIKEGYPKLLDLLQSWRLVAPYLATIRHNIVPMDVLTLGVLRGFTDDVVLVRECV